MTSDAMLTTSTLRPLSFRGSVGCVSGSGDCVSANGVSGSSSIGKTLISNVFIQIGPMNSLSVANPSPVVSLLGPAVNKPRIPRQRHGNGATVA